jgi:hypothetical protein
MDLKDLEPIEKGLSKLLSKVLQRGDAETYVLTFLGQEAHD